MHTDQRDYEWIVFKRQPDRISYKEEDKEEATPMIKVSDDEDFFSDEAEETIPTPISDERFPVDQDIQDEIKEAASKTTTAEAHFSSC